MKVALAHDHLFQIGGAENVLKSLHELYPDAPLHTLVCSDKGREFLPRAEILTSFLQKMPGGVSRFKWYLKMMPRAWERFNFSQYDAVLSSSSAFVKGLITPPETVHISYCHTPTRYLWSDREEYFESLRLPRPAKVYLKSVLDDLQEWDKKAASRVDYFVANSNFVADRISEYYDRESTVIYPPVPVDNFSISEDVGDYFLVVSRLRPYKRVDLVIEAFNNMKVPLVIIGGGEELGYLKKMAGPHITFLGEVSDEVRNDYLRRCKAFIHPQIEDFGISAVEAMASGRPVIAYGAGGALETVKEGVSGALFTEQSWEALAYAVLTLDYAQFDPLAIREWSKQFDQSVFRKKIDAFVRDSVRS